MTDASLRSTRKHRIYYVPAQESVRELNMAPGNLLAALCEDNLCSSMASGMFFGVFDSHARLLWYSETKFRNKWEERRVVAIVKSMQFMQIDKTFKSHSRLNNINKIDSNIFAIFSIQSSDISIHRMWVCVYTYAMPYAIRCMGVWKWRHHCDQYGIYIIHIKNVSYNLNIWMESQIGSMCLFKNSINGEMDCIARSGRTKLGWLDRVHTAISRKSNWL